MKRLVRLFLVISVCVFPCANVWAEDAPGTPELPTQAASEVAAAKPVEPPSPAEIAKNKERQKKIQEKRAGLEATQWGVNLVSNDPKVKPETDTFIFINGQFKSVNREKRGFASTNYTVTVPDGDDPSATFETMQSGKEGRAFIKGVWKEGLMEGRITEQSEDGKKSTDYFFTNAKMTPMDEETKKLENEKLVSAAADGVAKSLVSIEAPVNEAADESLPKSKAKKR